MQSEPPTGPEFDRRISEFFETRGLPSQRIELMLQEIKAQAQLVMDDFASKIAEREAKAEAAQADLLALDSLDTSNDANAKAARDAAEKRFVEAHKAIHPSVWQAAREALLNCALVREALANTKADEAVEAAMRAVNAWWRTRTAILEAPITYGLKVHKRRKVGGSKGAATRAAESANRNRQIADDFAERTQRRDTSRADIIKQLARKHGVSDRTIRRLIPPRTATT